MPAAALDVQNITIRKCTSGYFVIFLKFDNHEPQQVGSGVALMRTGLTEPTDIEQLHVANNKTELIALLTAAVTNFLD